MHIADGVVSTPVLISGAAVAAVGVAVGLKRMDQEDIPRIAVLTSALFVISLFSVPTPAGVPAHPTLNGLAGLILGWSAFPAFLISLLLQALLFEHGGLTALGVNVTTMATPAVLSYLLFSRMVRKRRGAAVAGFLAGAVSTIGSSLLVALALSASGDSFAIVAKFILIVAIPLVFMEGFLTASVVVFLRKVRPEVLIPHHDLEKAMEEHTDEIE